MQAGLQHGHHLVPGLEHLPAVDALQEEPLEDHLAPVDGLLARHDAEHCHLAAVVHDLEELTERAAVAAHLQADVEPLLHAQVGHHHLQVLLRHVDGAGGAELGGQPEPVVVHVGHHHVAGADVARHRRRHGADGAGPGDEHVLAHEVEGERGVHGVAVGVEDGRDVVGHVVGDLVDVDRGDGEQLGEGARAVHPDPHRVAAQVAPAGAAVAAEATRQVPLAAHPVTWSEGLHLRPHPLHHAHVLVAHDHGHGDGALAPLVPVVDVDVGAADGALPDADEDVVDAHLRLRRVPDQPDPFPPLRLRQGLHAASSAARVTGAGTYSATVLAS